MPASTNNPWFAATVGLGGLIVGYIVALSLNGGSLAIGNNNVPSGDQNSSAGAPVPPPTNNTPPAAGVGATEGSSSAKVTIIEFTDFQCPFCSRHYTQTFKEIKKNYIDTGKVKYELRHFPLSFHPNAQKAGEAAECANKQGKFWQMHDQLFTNQDAWSGLDAATAATTFKKYGAAIGVDGTKFASCLDNSETKDIIAKGIADGSAAGISGTPGFWILGPNDQSKMVEGAYPYATFSAAFDEMLK